MPEFLPHREEQLNFLLSLFGESVRRRSHLRCAQLVGGVGTGKTATAKRLAELLRSEAEGYGSDLRIAYVNLRKQGPSKSVSYTHLTLPTKA